MTRAPLPYLRATQALRRAWWVVPLVAAAHGWSLWAGMSYGRPSDYPRGLRLSLTPVTFVDGVASGRYSVTARALRGASRLLYYGATPLGDMRMFGLPGFGRSGGSPPEMARAAGASGLLALLFKAALSAVALVALAKALTPYGGPSSAVRLWRVFRVGVLSLLPVCAASFVPVALVITGARASSQLQRAGPLALAIATGVVLACLSLALRVCAAAQGGGVLGAFRALGHGPGPSTWAGLLALAGVVGWGGRWASSALSALVYAGSVAGVAAWICVHLLWAAAGLWCLALMLQACQPRAQQR